MNQPKPSPQQSRKIFSHLKSLPKTSRLPVLFIGHGSPMNAIEDNQFSRSWRLLGENLPKPQAIIVMSAHWTTPNGSFLTAMPKPKMIYDMYGFPQALYEQQYPAPGQTALAKEINSALNDIQLDHEWGFDHGCWSVLKQMYPACDIPVIQLSIDYSRTPLQEYELLTQLQELREHGILFIGSGNIIHNLRLINWEDNQPYDWAIEFDALSTSLIEKHDIITLANYQKLGLAANLSIPTDEHYRPMLGALALAHTKDTLNFFNTEIVMSSLGMRSFILK